MQILFGMLDILTDLQIDVSLLVFLFVVYTMSLPIHAAGAGPSAQDGLHASSPYAANLHPMSPDSSSVSFSRNSLSLLIAASRHAIIPSLSGDVDQFFLIFFLHPSEHALTHGSAVSGISPSTVCWRKQNSDS
jgi:hypothetical protein